MYTKIFIQSSKFSFIFSRAYCSVVENVRVRFAPSPTGNLHLGGVRTAFYNYLFARKNNGKFILRIEDTDQKRIKTGSLENLQDMLKWIGLEPDESPSSGGAYGPYLQSLRLDLYKEKAVDLLDRDKAYRCFCSETRLDIMRKEALRNRQNPGYDNKCRHLSPDEVEKLLEKKVPYTIRFKINHGPMTFEDIVYGTQTFDISGNEGDFVILKSDGFPTYHFANVVDDYEMKISHVLRGAEWLVSTTKHMMLYTAFGWTLPAFAHLPLLVNKDRTKLSKRQEAIGVVHFKNSGYEPLAVLNFLTSVGGGFGTGDREIVIHKLEDLYNKFSLNEVSRNSCFLDLSMVDAYNQKYIVSKLSNPESSAEILKTFRKLLQDELSEKYEPEIKLLSDEYIMKILNLYKERTISLLELLDPSMKFLWTSPEVSEVETGLRDFDVELAEGAKALKLTMASLVSVSEEDFTRKALVSVLKKSAEGTEFDYTIFMRCLRIMLTGKKDGPGVAEILDLLGKNESLKKMTMMHKKLSNLFVNNRAVDAK